ncbi:MAG: AzlD domain-containing protein [Acidimicrobiia bacterium]
MIELLAVVAVGVGTYLSRSIFILTLAKRRIPDSVLVALQFVAPAVLASLVVALLIDDQGRVAVGIPELSAFLIGGLVAYRTRNHIWTLLAGMTAYWLIRSFL